MGVWADWWAGEQARAAPGTSAIDPTGMIPQNPVPQGGSFINPLASGATFSFGDEVVGGLGGLASMVGGNTYMHGYEKVRDAIRDDADQFRARNPKTSMGLEIAGALPTAALPWGTVARTAGLGAKAVQGARIGAIEGGIYGAGEGRGSYEDKARTAIEGAGLGMLGGAAVPVAIAGGVAGGRAIKQAAEDAGGVGGLLGDFAADVSGEVGKKKPPKQIVGAPKGMDTPAKAARQRKSYAALMEDGTPYRLWYDQAGQSNLLHTGAKELEAARLTGAQAVTSASTAVDANLGHAIKANNQAAVEDIIRSGQYPKDMGNRIRRIYSAKSVKEILDILGEKTGPYGENIMEGGGFGPTRAAETASARAAAARRGIGDNGGPPLEEELHPDIDALLMKRPVHDIWDGRNWGYRNPDGSEFDGSFSPSQHRHMDKQMDLVIAKANRDQLGGVDDWNQRSAQAATWIPAKARKEKTSLAEAARDYSDYYDKYYGYGGREAIQGRTTSYPAELRDAPWAERQAYTDEVKRALQNEQGQDRISLGHNALTGTDIDGVGFFEGGINPGWQNRVALGRATGGESVDPASDAMMRSIQAQHGLVTGQDAAAYHLAGNRGAAIKRTNVLDFPEASGLDQLGGRAMSMTDEGFLDVMQRIQDTFGQGAAADIVPTPIGRGGFRLVNYSNVGAEDFVSFGRELSKKLGVSEPERYALIGGNLTSNNWKRHPLGQIYMREINRPTFAKAFDAELPTIAKRVSDINRQQFGSKIANVEVEKVLKIISNEGHAGLMKAITNGAASIGAVMMIMEVIGPSGDA